MGAGWVVRCWFLIVRFLNTLSTGVQIPLELREKLNACGVDPVSLRVASCLHSVSWTNGWILTKHAQTHYWEGGKKLLDFGDFDLIFKVTQALKCSHFDQKSLSAPCLLLNQMTDYGQTSYIVMLGWFKDLIRFGDRDLIFKVTTL